MNDTDVRWAWYRPVVKDGRYHLEFVGYTFQSHEEFMKGFQK